MFHIVGEGGNQIIVLEDTSFSSKTKLQYYFETLKGIVFML